MLFASGPRQVGKTTLVRSFLSDNAGSFYFNWDVPKAREAILAGPSGMGDDLGLFDLKAKESGQAMPVVVFDEIHKFGRWKAFLKGFFDLYESHCRVVVTGSAKLDVYRHGGDSLMGRYFPFRVHPISVGELLGPSAYEGELARGLIQEPRAIDDAQWEALGRFGGFPEPLLRADERFWNRWRRLRDQQLLREDLRELTRIQELGQLESLALLLRTRVGQLVSYSSLAKEIRASVDSTRRWIAVLERLYFCFALRPWHRNVARSLRKEPKYFLWDWSAVEDTGARAENQIASALLKAVHLWTDLGIGDFGLFFLRNKEKREVDFVVVRDEQPWFLVEVKRGAHASLSPHLAHFQRQTNAEHAFQVMFDAPYVEANCFEEPHPIRVPARTLLSQLP